jgi:hypothetical protein
MAQITENPARVGARNRAGNNLSTRQRFRHWPGEGPTGAFAFGLARGGRRRGHSCRRWPPCDVRDASGVEAGRGLDARIKGRFPRRSYPPSARSRRIVRPRQRRWPRGSVLDRRGRTHAQGRCAVSAEYERATIRAEWPAEFDDGARCGFLGRLESPREPSGHPLGFHGWPLARRNAWFAGFNKGNCDRTILQKEMAQND